MAMEDTDKAAIGSLGEKGIGLHGYGPCDWFVR